jgi:hypothetical protein
MDTYPLPHLSVEDGNVRPEVSISLEIGDKNLMNMVASQMKSSILLSLKLQR